MKLNLSYILFILLILSCNQNSNRTGIDANELDSLNIEGPKKVLTSSDTIGTGLPIFYNMYLSVEMTSLFETVGAIFNDDLLNTADNTSDYITSSKKAMNIGVYAVDLSYCRVFEQFELAGRYFTSMQKLAEEMGIPSDYFINTAKRFDRNISDKDSLISIANEVYVATDKYLKDNEQFNAAAQIILGGWIEAMHIAFDVASTTKDVEILERVAEQKYSLQNLIEMLKSYKDDEVTGYYIDKLNALQTQFNDFKVDVPSDFDVNSVEGKKHLNNYIKQIEGLKKSINESVKK
ncbi:MAG: hypothetical protein HC906_11405 [Bacteroidales bacterium]|nr:hypothetical protein [Bacteroidales bacterium]